MSQLFFDFYNSPNLNLLNAENFIFFSENQSAKNLLQKFFSVSDYDKNPYKTIIIKGESCSGKTHLLNIFANKFEANFIKPEQIFSVDPFDLFSDNKFFIIDDLDLAENDEQLLQIMNCATESRALLVMACRDTKNFELADLKSRIKNIESAQIMPANSNNLKLIFANILSRKQIFLEQKIVDYIFSNIALKYSEIAHVAKAIEFYINQNDRKFSLTKIEEILAPRLVKQGAEEDLICKI